MSRISRKHSLALRLPIILFILLSAALLTAQPLEFAPVSKELIQSRLRRYDGTDAQRATTLKQMFSEAGCQGENLKEQKVKGSKLPNIICVLPGTGDKSIIVGAHFDHAEVGDGVIDNWSGASLLPSLYEALRTVPRKHTYIFIGFTDEERGLIGSHFYVKSMSKEQVASTDGMINMDTLGLSATKVWASRSDPKLLLALRYIAQLVKAQLDGVNVENIGSSDSEQFAARKIPSLTIHSFDQEAYNAQILHTQRDNIYAVKLDDYYQSYRLISVYLAYLDVVQLPPATGQ